jgi:CMP-N-acetylneuraminic acid synthetase
MICALLIGREGSLGFPGKNLLNVLGRPLCSYPMIAASESKSVERLYVSTDSSRIREIADNFNAILINRPDHLADKNALGEDAFKHGFDIITKDLKSEGLDLEFLILLMCNSPTINGALIDKGIQILREKPEADSAVTVSIYNMWSPTRARKKDINGYLQPFVPFDAFEQKGITCDRDSQGDVFFADMGVSIVRSSCFHNMEENLPPQKWMGNKILPIPNWGGLDVDYPWQIGMVDFWLRENGIKYHSMDKS